VHFPTIRAMTPVDAGPTADAIERAGWGARHVKMAFVARHPECRPFVADMDGTIVGSGVTTVNGPVAWIGTIWVDPAWRGRGLGKALTLTTIEAAEAAGCQTLVLVATDAGRPLYERLGFEIQAHYRTMEAPGLADAHADARVRAYRADDLASMSALDATATGEDRAHLLRAFAAPETTKCIERADGTVGGFVLRAPWGGGATIVPDPDDALTLLHARRVASTPEKRVRAGILDTNDGGRERLLGAGWTDAWSAPRLVRGDMPAWNPNQIWGQFDHATG
jgi:predicted N-acetyltransferase YhbS